MADEKQETTKKSGGRAMQLVIVLALMLGEGAAVFLVANAMGPDPALTQAGQGDGAEADVEDEAQLSEVELAECRPTNRTSGRLITLHLKVTGLVLTDKATNVEELAKAAQSRILDRVQFVVRSAEIQHLNEPELGTIKRRLKSEFDRIFNDPDMIKEVLIPVWQQSGSGV